MVINCTLHVIVCIQFTLYTQVYNTVLCNVQCTLTYKTNRVSSFRYSNVRVAISVSLSKKIALHTWIVAAIPQVDMIYLNI